MSRNSLAAFLLFLSGFSWMLLLTAGLPLTFGDDMQLLQAAINVSWESLIRHGFTPLSPAWYIPSTDAFFSTRAFETVVVKLIFFFKGYDAEIFHLFKDLVFAGVGIGIYCFTTRITKSVAIGVYAGWLFFAAPFVYQSASWISDFELVSQLLLILSALAFLRLYQRGFSWPLLIATVLSAWLGYKTKESCKMLPFIAIGFLAWSHFRRSETVGDRPTRASWITAIILLVLVVPTHFQQFSLRDPNQSRVLHVWELVLNNPHVRQFLSHPIWAIFGLAIFVFAVVMLIRLLFCGLKVSTGPFLRFACVWLGVMLVATLLFRTQFKWRYLTILWIPLTILMGVEISEWSSSSHVWMRFLGKMTGLSVVFLVGGFGIFYTVYLRNHMSIKDTAAFGIAQLVYRDRFGVENPGQSELMNFFLGKPPAEPHQFDGFRVNEWDVIYNQSIPETEHTKMLQSMIDARLKKWGHVYYTATKDHGTQAEQQGRLIGTVSTASRSLYCRLMSKFGHKFPVYRVYRVGEGG